MGVSEVISPGELTQSDIEILKEIGCNERHFNTIQAGYRKLASGWMLAALGAFGWLQLHLPDAWPIALIVAVGASTGIGLLWLLDVRVYHELLVANFVAAKELEEKLAGCYRLHTKVQNSAGSTVVRRRITRFYIGLGLAPLTALLATHFVAALCVLVLLMVFFFLLRHLYESSRA
jgi:hypothetical protein